MKKLAVIAFVLTFALQLSGCGSTLDAAQVSLDKALLGEDIVFEYNKEAKLIKISGEIEYYEQDILKGWDKAGNRIGLTFVAPSGVNELESGSLEYLDQNIGGGEFYTQVNGSKVARFTIYPLIEENTSEFEIKLTWQEGAKVQVYKVKLEDVKLKENTL